MLDPSPRRSNPALLLLLLAVAAIGWSWLAFGVHTIEVGGGEIDQYVIRARQMLAGSDNHDPYHPSGYPLLLAAFGWLGIDPFDAARGLGVAFGVLLVWASHALARCWLPPLASLLVAASVGASEHVVTLVVQACSDAPAAALVACTMLVWVRALQRGVTARRLLIAALLLGIATSFRTQSSWFAAGFVPLLWHCSWRERTRRIALTTLGGIVGQLPHLAWFAHVFGSPLYNRAWHSLLLKFHYDFDAPAWVLGAANYDAILREQWPTWLLPAARDAVVFVGTGLASGITAVWPVAVALSLAMLVGHADALWRRDPARCVIALGALCYAALQAAAFRATDRFTLPLVLTGVLALLLPWRRRPRVATTLALALTAAVLTQLPRVLREFAAQHPHRERAEVAALAERLGEPLRALVRPFWPLRDHVDPWRQLRAELHAHDQEFAVFTRATSTPAIEALLAAPLPPDFTIVRNDDVLVLDATATPEPPILRASVQPRGDHLELRVTPAPWTAGDPPLTVGFLFGVRRDAARTWSLLPLQPRGDGEFALVLPIGDLRGIDCRFVPALLHASGMIRRGTAIELRP